MHYAGRHHVMPFEAALWLLLLVLRYAASKLFNGEYKEALAVTNLDGTRLFPDKDPNKWNAAVAHIISLLYVWKRSYISCEGLPVFSNS